MRRLKMKKPNKNVSKIFGFEVRATIKNVLLLLIFFFSLLKRRKNGKENHDKYIMKKATDYKNKKARKKFKLCG